MNNFNSTLRYIDALPRKQRRRNNMQLANTSFSGGGSLPLSGLVTIADPQIITGIKDYINGLKVGGLPIYKSIDDTIYIDANVVVRGGITARGTNTTQSPSIFEALPIDGDTIKRTTDGRLYVDADALNISGGGGVADSVSWENVTGKPSWIGSTKPTYAPQEIGALPITGGTLDGALLFTAAAGGRKFGIYKDGSVRFNATTGDGWATGIYVYNNDGSTQLGTSAGAFGVGGTLSYFYYGGTWDSPKMAILPTGNVSIGGTTADAKLHIHGTVRAEGVIHTTNWLNDTGQIVAACSGTSYKIGIGATSGGYAIVQGGQSGVGAIPLLLNPSGGNVAIGGTTADAKLHVHGNLLATGGITARYTSDMRLKQNRRSFKASEVLMSLGAVQQFEYIPSEVEKNKIYEGTHIGLIYQNVVGTALNRMCHKREDGYGSLNYLEPSFISLLASVGQEHEVRIQQLERENKTPK